MAKKTQHICTMWKTCQDIEVSSNICFAHMQGSIFTGEVSSGKNVGVAKMPKIKLSVDYILRPGHLKNPRVVLPTALFSVEAKARRGLIQNELIPRKYKYLCNK